jgi:hypothetical protein
MLLRADTAKVVRILLICMPQREIPRLAAAYRCNRLDGALAFSLVALGDWVWKLGWGLAQSRGDEVGADVGGALKRLRACTR